MSKCIFTTVLVAALAFSSLGCGQQSSAPPSDTPDTTTSPQSSEAVPMEGSDMKSMEGSEAMPMEGSDMKSMEGSETK